MKKHSYKNTRECDCCGKVFTYPAHHPQRRYCSRSCGSKASYNRGLPGEPVWGHDKGVFDAAMEMYWGGYGGTAVAQHFNIPVGTVYSWIHDFGNQKERKAVIKPLMEQFRAASDTGEWLGALRGNTLACNTSFDGLNMRLVCGTMHGQSVNKLTAVVTERLKEDPLCGKSYAFCNKGRNVIAVLSWIDPVYHIGRYVKARGTYIWPDESLGTIIEISRDEFERLLLLGKQRKTSVKIY